MDKLKAFAMDDYGTVYAALSVAHAIEVFKHDTGEIVSEADVYELSDEQLDALIPGRDENEALTGEMESVRQWLNETTEAGLIAGAL